MYIEKWILATFVFLFFYVAYKVTKHQERIHDLQHDLNDLEIQVGVLEGEDWAINSDINQRKGRQKKQEYYDGKTNNGEYDGMLGIDRRKRDGKNPKLGSAID
jgi:hypothetical protein